MAARSGVRLCATDDAMSDMEGCGDIMVQKANTDSWNLVYTVTTYFSHSFCTPMN